MEKRKFEELKSFGSQELVQIGNRHKELRKRVGLTQIEMAKLADIRNTYISQFEKGNWPMGTKHAYFLAKNKVNLNYIFTGEGALFLDSNKECEE